MQGGGLELPVNCSHEGGMSGKFDFQVNHNLLQPLVPIPIFAPSIEPQLMNMIPDSGEFSKLNRQPLRAFCLKWVENTRISACYGCLGLIKRPTTYELEKFAIVYRDTRFACGNKYIDKLQNVHFHLNPECVRRKYREFVPSSLVIPPAFFPFLSVDQKQFLARVFNIALP